jgi:arylesterase/paraoxonase
VGIKTGGLAIVVGLTSLLWAPGSLAVAFQNCGEPIGEMMGPEDFEVDLTSAGAPRLLVSAYDRRAQRDGGIYAISLPRQGPREVKKLPVDRRAEGPRSGCPLRPHGISLVRTTDDGSTRLYLVNHSLEEDAELADCDVSQGDEIRLHSVAIFRVEADRLVHEETVVDPLLISPNDLVALPNRQIYVSNEISYRSYLLKLLELAHLFRSSNVVHLSPSESGWDVRNVAEGFRYANGVAVSDERLFVAAVLDRTIHEFERDPATGNVGERIREIPVGSGVDNLMWSGPHLTVAAHPSIRAYLRHVSDADAPSPSEVYRVDPASDPPVVTRIHSNDGSVISASSTAMVYQDTLFIGQVLNQGIVACER